MPLNFVYNIIIKRRTEQPGSPKSPDTSGHIPVSRQRDAIARKMPEGAENLNQIKEDKEMSERMIVNRVKKLKALEAQQKEIEAQIEALKDEIKADMQERGIEQQAAGDFPDPVDNHCKQPL